MAPHAEAGTLPGVDVRGNGHRTGFASNGHGTLNGTGEYGLNGANKAGINGALRLATGRSEGNGPMDLLRLRSPHDKFSHFAFSPRPFSDFVEAGSRQTAMEMLAHAGGGKLEVGKKEQMSVVYSEGFRLTVDGSNNFTLTQRRGEVDVVAARMTDPVLERRIERKIESRRVGENDESRILVSLVSRPAVRRHPDAPVRSDGGRKRISFDEGRISIGDADIADPTAARTVAEARRLGPSDPTLEAASEVIRRAEVALPVAETNAQTAADLLPAARRRRTLTRRKVAAARGVKTGPGKYADPASYEPLLAVAKHAVDTRAANDKANEAVRNAREAGKDELIVSAESIARLARRRRSEAEKDAAAIGFEDPEKFAQVAEVVLDAIGARDHADKAELVFDATRTLVADIQAARQRAEVAQARLPRVSELGDSDGLVELFLAAGLDVKRSSVNGLRFQHTSDGVETTLDTNGFNMLIVARRGTGKEQHEVGSQFLNNPGYRQLASGEIELIEPVVAPEGREIRVITLGGQDGITMSTITPDNRKFSEYVVAASTLPVRESTEVDGPMQGIQEFTGTSLKL